MFFCHESSHMAQACLVLLHTKSDPFAHHLIICLLQDHIPSMSHSPNEMQQQLQSCPSPRSSVLTRSPQMHALTTDHDVLTSSDNSDMLLDDLLSHAPPEEDVISPGTDLDQDFYLAC